MSLKGTRVLDIYTVDDLLGVGGMGEVWTARSNNGHKLVVKVLTAEFSARADIVKRFEGESRAASELRNPHIVVAHGDGKLPDGRHFVALEHLEGVTLDAWMRAWWSSGLGPLPIERALAILVPLASALNDAHKAGIVHRDLKPGNVFVCNFPIRGWVKLIDFGIAKVRNASGASDTRANTAMGTPGFMAPEQCLSARDVDGRADVWALGVIAFWMLTGQLPVTVDTSDETDPIGPYVQAYTRVGDGLLPPLSPRNLRSDLPDGWVKAIEDALAIRVPLRTQSARSFAQRLIEHTPRGLEIALQACPSFNDAAGPDDDTAAVNSSVRTPLPGEWAAPSYGGTHSSAPAASGGLSAASVAPRTAAARPAALHAFQPTVDHANGQRPTRNPSVAPRRVLAVVGAAVVTVAMVVLAVVLATDRAAPPDLSAGSVPGGDASSSVVTSPPDASAVADVAPIDATTVSATDAAPASTVADDHAQQADAGPREAGWSARRPKPPTARDGSEKPSVSIPDTPARPPVDAGVRDPKILDPNAPL